MDYRANKKLRSIRQHLGRVRADHVRLSYGTLKRVQKYQLVSQDWLLDALETRALALEYKIATLIGVREDK